MVRALAALTAGITLVAGAALVAATPLQCDAARGAEIYTRCQACHALEYNRTGPRHCGVVGRK